MHLVCLQNDYHLHGTNARSKNSVRNSLYLLRQCIACSPVVHPVISMVAQHQMKWREVGVPESHHIFLKHKRLSAFSVHGQEAGIACKLRYI